MKNEFESWLQKDFEFERTLSGSVARIQGVPALTEESQLRLNRYLGVRSASGVTAFRRGDRTSARVALAIKETLEYVADDDLEGLLRMRCERAALTEIKGAIRQFDATGTAPDGAPSLRRWTVRCVRRWGRHFGVEAVASPEFLGIFLEAWQKHR